MRDDVSVYRQFLLLVESIIKDIECLPPNLSQPFQHWPRAKIDRLGEIAAQLEQSPPPIVITKRLSLYLRGPDGGIADIAHRWPCEDALCEVCWPLTEPGSRRGSKLGRARMPAGACRRQPMTKETLEHTLAVLRQWLNWAESAVRSEWLPVGKAAEKADIPAYKVSRLCTDNKIAYSRSSNGRRLVDMSSLIAYLHQKNTETFLKSDSKDDNLESEQEVVAKFEKVQKSK